MKIVVLACAVVLVALGAASVSASPVADTRIRHGAGIGKLRLGMTYAEVRRILGGPQTVDKRQRLRDGRRYLQFSWDFGWWTVGFMGRPGKLRVALIQTLNARERTIEGLGVGNREGSVRRALRVRCADVHERARPDFIPFERRCAFASHRGRETAFVLGEPPGYPWTKAPYLVVVAVRVHERRADYCLRGGYLCRSVP